jgi:mono/diheme cytochrome c family protein
MTGIRTRLATGFAAGAVVLVAVLGVATAQQPAPTIKKGTFEPLVSVEGKDNFVAYCAVCHGVNGKGNGPAVPALKVMVPDLTTMEKRTGKFDQIAVERFIAGVDKVPPAHGSQDMPMWGPLFRSQGNETVATLRLKNLAAYLKTIQAGS